MREHSLKRSTGRRSRGSESADSERIDRIRTALGDPSHVERLSRTFRALGDPTRSKLVFALSLEELCVTELAAALGASLSATSHQLRILRDLDIVRVRRSGKSQVYALNEQAFGFCSPRSCHAWRQIDAGSIVTISRAASTRRHRRS
jgi:ArsR family transcriptional regulator, lead/cadmium/zinc/bismuth-responsive transcriptional repressor